MKPPALNAPFFEPDAVWHDSPPPAPGPGGLLASVIAVIVVVLLLWDDVARNGVFPGVTGPRQLAPSVPLAALGWLLCGVVAGLAMGACRAANSGASPGHVPRLPVFLRFDGRRVVVVGGGPMAAAKIPALLDAGADVTVIAPALGPAIDPSRVRVVARRFVPADLDGAWFVTAAASPEVNRQVRDAAEARRVFVNAVDDPAHATAYLGGTIVRGGVTVAISTAGKAPALAGLLREAFDALLPDDIDVWAAHAHDLSRRQRAEGVAMVERRPQLLDALNRLYESRKGSRAKASAGS